MRGPGRGGGRWPSLGLDQKGTAPRLLRLPTNARRCVVGQRRKDLSARRRPRTQAQGPLSLPAVRSSHFSPFFSFPRLRSTQPASFRPAFFPSPCLSTLEREERGSDRGTWACRRDTFDVSRYCRIDRRLGWSENSSLLISFRI